jgi:hypothetical protein
MLPLIPLPTSAPGDALPGSSDGKLRRGDGGDRDDLAERAFDAVQRSNAGLANLDELKALRREFARRIADDDSEYGLSAASDAIDTRVLEVELENALISEGTKPLPISMHGRRMCWNTHLSLNGYVFVHTNKLDWNVRENTNSAEKS